MRAQRVQWEQCALFLINQSPGRVRRDADVRGVGAAPQQRALPPDQRLRVVCREPLRRGGRKGGSSLRRRARRAVFRPRADV